MMKKILSLSLLACAAIILSISSCKKDDNPGDPAAGSFRISSEKYYSQNVVSGTTTYTYANNLLTKENYVEDSYTEEILFTYPDANTIIAAITSTEGNLEAHFTLENNKITEFIVPLQESKMSFSYNSDGSISESVSYYLDGTTWYPEMITTSVYSGGKLTTVNYGEDDGLGTIVNYQKDEIYYNGNEISEIITSYFDGDIWFDAEKVVYLHEAGKKVKISNFYSWDGTNWEVDYFTDYTYDENGNLISSAENGDAAYRTEYTYEAGKGNFSQIFGFLDYERFEPAPVKKAGGILQNLVKPQSQSDLKSLVKSHRISK